MCGEIFSYQRTETVTIHNASWNKTRVQLDKLFENVQEVWLDEIQIVGFNGGAAGVGYLRLEAQSLKPAPFNNENQNGLAIAWNPNNPKTVYQRPVVLFRSYGASFQELLVSLVDATGAAISSTDCFMRLTLVVRRSAAEAAEIRAALQSEENPMAGIRVDPRSTFGGRGNFFP